MKGRWWVCIACGEQNSELDGECQFCVCEGPECERDNCSGPNHAGQGDNFPEVGDMADDPPSNWPARLHR